MQDIADLFIALILDKKEEDNCFIFLREHTDDVTHSLFLHILWEMEREIFTTGNFFYQCLTIFIFCIETHMISLGIFSQIIDTDIVCYTIEPTREFESNIKTIERSIRLDKNNLSHLFYFLVRSARHTSYVSQNWLFITVDNQGITIWVLEGLLNKLSIA